MQMKLEGAWVESARSLSASLFGSFKIGTELLLYNGILTYLGLYMISKPPPVSKETKEIIAHAHR
jgi:hypothetical protein